MVICPLAAKVTKPGLVPRKCCGKTYVVVHLGPRNTRKRRKDILTAKYGLLERRRKTELECSVYRMMTKQEIRFIRN